MLNFERPLGLSSYLFALTLLAVGCSSDTVTSIQQRKILNANINNPLIKEYLWNISKEFDRNSIVAEDKYLFKPVEVQGVKLSGLDDGTDNATVSINMSATLPPNASWELWGASTKCLVKRSHPAVAMLQKNDELVLRGVFVSESSGLVMDRCRFWISRLGKWF